MLKVAVHTSQESLRRKHLNFQTAVHTSHLEGSSLRVAVCKSRE